MTDPSPPLQDAEHALLAQLHWCWNVAQDWALKQKQKETEFILARKKNGQNKQLNHFWPGPHVYTFDLCGEYMLHWAYFCTTSSTISDKMATIVFQ